MTPRIFAADKVQRRLQLLVSNGLVFFIPVRFFGVFVKVLVVFIPVLWCFLKVLVVFVRFFGVF